MEAWAARFDAFVRRKEADAVAARLWPFQTAQLGSTTGMETLGNRWTRELYDGDFYLTPPTGHLPETSLVIIQSKDGNTGAADPSTLGGGATDKHLIYEGLSRVAADGVLAGAETVRGGDVLFSVWRPELVALRDALGLPRHPTQVVATLHGLAFDRALLLNVPSVPVVVLTMRATAAAMTAQLAQRPWISVIELDDPRELQPAFARLRERGIRRLSCVGGHTVARGLIDAGLVRDLYLTTSARTGGEPGTPLYPRPLDRMLVVRKRGTGPEAGVLFEHCTLIAAG